MKAFRKASAVLTATGAALYALPLLAAEAGEKTGLPQLDTSQFPEQLFWLAVTFGLLYVLMAFVALPGVKRTQDNRQTTIASELAAAQAANDAAKAMIAHYEKTLADARANAHATIGEIVAKAAAESTAQQMQQQQALHKKLHDAENKIKAARDAALKDVSGAAATLAQAIVEKVTGARVKA